MAAPQYSQRVHMDRSSPELLRAMVVHSHTWRAYRPACALSQPRWHLHARMEWRISWSLIGGLVWSSWGRGGLTGICRSKRFGEQIEQMEVLQCDHERPNLVRPPRFCRLCSSTWLWTGAKCSCDTSGRALAVLCLRRRCGIPELGRCRFLSSISLVQLLPSWWVDTVNSDLMKVDNSVLVQRLIPDSSCARLLLWLEELSWWGQPSRVCSQAALPQHGEAVFLSFLLLLHSQLIR